MSLALGGAGAGTIGATTKDRRATSSMLPLHTYEPIGRRRPFLEIRA
jgi:hypothetical protein